MSSSGGFCSTRFRVALCGFASAASSRTGAAVNYCRFAEGFFRLRCHRTQQHRMFLPPVLPAHGSVRIAAELWSSSKSSLLNRCFGDLWGGRASLTLHRNPSSSSRVLAPARQFEVCPESVVGQKTNQKSVWRPKQVPTIPVLPTSEARPQDHRRLQIRRTRGSPID